MEDNNYKMTVDEAIEEARLGMAFEQTRECPEWYLVLASMKFYTACKLRPGDLPNDWHASPSEQQLATELISAHPKELQGFEVEGQDIKYKGQEIDLLTILDNIN